MLPPSLNPPELFSAPGCWWETLPTMKYSKCTRENYNPKICCPGQGVTLPNTWSSSDQEANGLIVQASTILGLTGTSHRESTLLETSCSWERSPWGRHSKEDLPSSCRKRWAKRGESTWVPWFDAVPHRACDSFHSGAEHKPRSKTKALLSLAINSGESVVLWVSSTSYGTWHAGGCLGSACCNRIP